MKHSLFTRLHSALWLCVIALTCLIELPNASMAQESDSLDDGERQEIVQAILEASGGGTQTKKQWELNNHWVGDLQVVVTTGAYKKGGDLASLIDARSVRLNALREKFRLGLGATRPPTVMSAWGKYSTNHYSYRDKLPSVEQLRDSKKQLEILASFGQQHGWTDAWGDPERMHWTEGWSWFNLVDDGRIRVLSIFAHVSTGTKEKDQSKKSIDHMIIREGFLRKSDPTNADDLKRFPTAESEEDKRQQKIEQGDLKFPEPLRALLQARNARGDSELKAYFAAIGEFRKNPDQELLKQLVANLDEGSQSFTVMAEYLFDDKFMGKSAGPWPAEKREEAGLLLIRALPSANSKESMRAAVQLILRETGIETLKMRDGVIDVDITSRYTKNGRTGSDSNFDIDEDDVKRSGEIIRDKLLKLHQEQ